MYGINTRARKNATLSPTIMARVIITIVIITVIIIIIIME